MYRNLLRTSALACVDKGRRILARLQADPRLTDATAEMQAAQSALETKLTAFRAAVETARTADAVRDESCRNLENRLREFGLNVLSVTRNHHDADLYLRYFPEGYGEAIHLKPPEMLAFAEVTLGKLAEETDPWLVSFRERITEARDALVTAEEAYQTCLRGRKDAFEYLAAEKRQWLRGLVRARLKGQEVCLSEMPYLHSIFFPALPRHRNVVAEPPGDLAPATVETSGVVELPSQEAPEPSQQVAV